MRKYLLSLIERLSATVLFTGSARPPRLVPVASGLRRFQRDESANVIVMAGLLLPLAVGATGAAVSYSSSSSVRSNMQGALDAAVLAGATMIGNSQGVDPIQAAQNMFQTNMQKAMGGAGNSFTASFTVSGITISGEAGGTVSNPFAGIFGVKNFSVAVNAAAIKDGFSNICVLGLNGFDRGSFDINGNPSFNADCAVQANSTSSSGMTQEGQAAVKARKFGVSGGHKTNNFVPPPSDGAAKVADPYASLPFPSHGVCDSKGKGLTIKEDTTLSPGTYCGGIRISSTANVKLEPGVYVMVDGPFWMTGGSVATGDNVMLAFTGKDSSLYVWGNSSLNVTSPISGTYSNMQFMSDRDSGALRGTWVSIGGNDNGTTGNAKLSYDGVAYFPNQNFWMFGNAVVKANSPTIAIVADKIWTQGSATVNVTNINRRNLAVKTVQSGFSGARLIN
jgi:hypothetical protein